MDTRVFLLDIAHISERFIASICTCRMHLWIHSCLHVLQISPLIVQRFCNTQDIYSAQPWDMFYMYMAIGRQQHGKTCGYCASNQYPIYVVPVPTTPRVRPSKRAQEHRNQPRIEGLMANFNELYEISYNSLTHS